MNAWILGGVSAAALISAPGIGWSLTAQEAWQSWQEAASSYGQTLTNDGEETMDGKLTVRNVTMSADMDDARIAATIGEVVFAEQGDGTVAITMSESFPLTVDGTDSASGEKVDVTVTVEQPGLEMVASDADGGTQLEYSAPALLVKVAEIKIDDQDFPMQLEVALTDSTGRYAVKSEPGAPVESSFEAAAVTVMVNAKDPEGNGEAKVNAAIAGLTSSSVAKGMDGADPEEMATMLAAGFDVEGVAEYGATTFDFDFNDNGVATKMAGSLTGGSIGFGLDAEGMLYDVGYEGLDFALSGSEIPFPQVTAKLASAATTFRMPVLQSDTAAPFVLRTALEGLEIGEEIWSLFDPAGVLPRDPATLIVDLAGTGRWSIDIFDEEAMMATETSGAAPGAVESIEVRELKLALAGAELTGSGAFALDNSDMQTFDGMPRPEGSANLRLVGGNALLEKLTQMGLVPEDQVMMVRMMTGMFAKPGSGPDELLSEIAVDGSGKVLINGAPMPF
ncbi:DUF2125 domain-containing protein [Tropicimonas sp. IMCC6043]|uniref:DUF2125 domain-containing protein n=1 Tax=Tropicimonas sp. IMCC6043 TaxID=2510645 RepID=UPI00101C82F4|nr:DUF2125 domain-containing protein [Tropicimonas sp. IMCC6043]RYH08688.1 DUF2125 domain-containing protein [Tropicimonas sp. IMCC6043]